MAVKWKTKKNKFPEMIKETEILSGKKVQVGVFGGEHEWLAAIHEWGCDIKPKNAHYLTVPVNPKAKGKRAKEFKNLFVVESTTGEKFLARDLRGSKGEIELLYWLTKSVRIPERSFLRSGYDECINDVMKHSDELLKQVTTGKMTADKFFEGIGKMLATQIKTYARKLNDPENKQATIDVKGTDNPLVDTEDMINHISWRVVE
ncbi:MAG: hypothetical protein LUD81_10555 [Clostridiales bacterium]|nr:hypothetical protein [Clostridiales bacterium]